MELERATLTEIADELDRRKKEITDVRRRVGPMRDRLGDRRYVWAKRAREVRAWLQLDEEDAALFGECSQAYVSMCEAGKRPSGARKYVLKLIKGAIVDQMPSLAFAERTQRKFKRKD